MDTAKLLLELSARTGVSGTESDVVEFAAGLLQPYGKVETTPLGSLLCHVREPKPGEPHLLLDAHIDEIGMVVTYIEEDGFLRVAAVGGVDRRLLMASPVTVHTADGPLTAVICSIPPHLSAGQEEKNKKVDEIYIDTGLGKEEAERRILPGDRVTLCSNPRELLGGQVSGKAIDDRAGCAAHLKALEYLADTELNCGLTVLFSSQEEVGGPGAKTAAYQVGPTYAVAVDVSFAYTPDAQKEKCGEMKKGPMVGFAPILNREMSLQLTQLAADQKIPFQREIMGGPTGTNADHIAVSRGGVKTALLSIPQKYMHTPVETVAVCDVENTGRLIAAYAKTLGGANA